MPDDARAARVRQFLKAELKRHSITYEELARRLTELGDQETKASVANKLSRGQFSAIFFVDTLRAIGVEKVDLEDI
jgi:3-mercaptopyruvate sulfurtransferase SseA